MVHCEIEPGRCESRWRPCLELEGTPRAKIVLKGCLTSVLGGGDRNRLYPGCNSVWPVFRIQDGGRQWIGWSYRFGVLLYAWTVSTNLMFHVENQFLNYFLLHTLLQPLTFLPYVGQDVDFFPVTKYKRYGKLILYACPHSWRTCLCSCP
ncbi:uncharacterized protein LOC144927290 [Branchiostoma floridae x Branchiostoma belcheri]